MTISVLFVCLGNICRSPMAEAIFRKMAEDAGLADGFEIDSAGTHAYHVGEPPHPGTQAALYMRGIDTTGMISRELEVYDVRHFDYLVAMDGDNRRHIEALYRQFGGVGRIVNLLAYADPAVSKGITDVPDPFFTGFFEYTYELIESGCAGLLDTIRREHGL